MNSIKIKTLALSVPLIFSLSSAQAKTVKDIIKSIEKKQGSIPIYKQQLNQKKDRVNLSIIQPSGRFSAIFPEGSAERDFERKLNKEIDQLHYLSKKLKGAETKQKIWMRLAKAYSEKAALIERRKQEEYDSDLKKFFAGSTNKKPTLNLAEAQVYNQKALNLYKHYVKTYPKAYDLDQALFFLGYNSVVLGNTKEAIGYYKALSAKYPNSDYIGEANLSLGDYYFDKDQRASARTYYSKVASKNRNALSSLAIYKLSWVDYKMGNHRSALKGLLKVIKLADNSGSRNQKSLALATEAKKDLPMFYAEAGDPKNALTYFTNIMSREEASRAIEKLAYYYVDKGDKEEAEYLFSKLIRMNPQNDKSFDYQYSLVTMQASKGRSDLYERELYKWVNQFGPKSKWARTSKDKVKVMDSLKKAEVALRSHVLKIHNEARDQKSKGKMLRAEQGYDLYLRSFETGPFNAEMQFYNAELLYELGAYKDAYAAYQKVKPSKYTAKANLNSVLSLEKTIPTDQELRAKIGKSTKKVPLSKDEEVFIQAAEAYLGDIKNREQRSDIKYRIASIYYTHNYFEKSEPVFKEIIKEFPGSNYAAYSSDLIIDSYKLTNDYDGLAKAGAELISIGQKSGGVKTSKVKTVLEQSAFKRIEDMVGKSSSLEVAEAFMGFTKSYPKSVYQNKAFYNAGINYEKAGRAKEALSAYSVVSSSDSLYGNAQKFSAFLYEKLGYLTKAAGAYETLADAPVTSVKDRAKYFSNAAVIREAFNDAVGVSRIFKKLKKYDAVKNTYNYDFRLAEIYQRVGKYDSAKASYLKFFNLAKGDSLLLVKAARKIADYYQGKKSYEKSRYWYRAATLTYAANKRKGAKAAASDAAHSAFRLTDKLFYDYLAVKIPSDPKKQKRVLDQKLALVTKIEKEMTKVINYDDGYAIVSALSRMGQVHQHLTFSLLTAPLPKGLSTEEKAQYQKILESTVAPFKKNAVTAYKKALEKGLKLNTYNKDYQSTLFELSKVESEFNIYKVPFISANKLIQYDAATMVTYPSLKEDLSKSEAVMLDSASKKLSSDEKSASALYTLAQFYHSKGLTRVSNLYLSKTEKSFQASSDYFVLKGLNKMLENDRRGAVVEFKNALKKDSGQLLARINLSALYAQRGGYQASYDLLKDYKDSKEIPQNVKHFIINNYALGLLSKGMVDDATSEFKKVLKVNPRYVGAVGNLAIIEKVISKNKNGNDQYLSQYKKLANTQVDLDRIRLMEKM